MQRLSLYSTATQNPQHQNFALGIPTCWYLKMLKFALPPTRNLKFALPPTRTPNAYQWNIVCLGCSGIGSRVGHVHFIFFVSISCALGTQFPVEYGLYSGFGKIFYAEHNFVRGMYTYNKNINLIPV